jgi:guanylate kinase
MFSISHTTRKRRVGERNGRAYHFVSDAQFDRLARSDYFAEHFQVHLYKYGTPREPLERVRRNGGVILLDVDVNGARKLRKEYPDAVSIFILPPSVRKRLRQRGTETPEQLKIRFENARREMKTFRSFGFDYVVVNKELEVAVRQVLSIIEAHDCRLEHMTAEQLKKITG